MARPQRYGIKFPFTADGEANTLLDLSNTLVDEVNSEIMHVIFTPKGQRLRDPEFGTNLIQYIFSPNDSQTWDDIIREVREAVSRYVPDTTLKNVEIREGENPYELYARITYSVESGGYITDYETITRL